ncbi:hypothetical protein L9G74_18035 [Shewanella sp. C32]|uniref:Haem-binding uptake Tiki superfamily ChaN domain-containing protein n=1 Tax=Shewanella electrica TaxID=515560 RepID=A0ABT2FPS4_9GAMM|nr:hypothetical protein [Shewanella electrica]MCH1926783.1 hypothetical protein [Shewanella electrica]MCS4558344.1 hypothetical protein [Shewanella electrica]
MTNTWKLLTPLLAGVAASTPLLSLACEPVPQLVMNTVQAKDISLIGEYHGTKETPQAFYNLVCNVLEKAPNKPLTVGFELTTVEGMALTDQASLDNWLAADDEWVAPHDGRSSKAMYQLLQRMVQAKQTHPNLSIVLFNVPTGDRDTFMANNIISAYHGQKMLLLAGNFHTQLKQTDSPDFANAPAPMGSYIFNQYPQQTASIVISYHGGTQWAWDFEEGKGVYSVGKSQLTKPHQARILNAAEAARTGYDMAWNIGEVNASYPYIHTAADDHAHMPTKAQ